MNGTSETNGVGRVGAPAVGQLVVVPAPADPLVGLAPMPPREGLAPIVQPYWDVMEKNRRHELSLESSTDYTKAGEDARDALSYDGDTELVATVKKMADRLDRVGHGYKLGAALRDTRADLLVYTGPIRRGADKLEDDVRDELHAKGYVGLNFTHTEVKQSGKAASLMAEPELRDKSEQNALNKVRQFRAGKLQEAAASDNLRDGHGRQVAEWRAKLDAEAQRGDALRSEADNVWSGAMDVRKAGKPVAESRRKRASEMTYGLLLQPNKKADHKAAGKSWSPGTQRDRGLLATMQLDNESIVSDLRFDRVANGFINIAKGNALAQTIAAANTLRATAATAPSSLASLDNVDLDQIIAAAQAAKVAKAADAAAAQAQAAVPAAAAPAAQ